MPKQYFKVHNHLQGGMVMSEEKGSHQEKYYPSKEVCEIFDISSSTLRKWCLSLEKYGYTFTRTTQNRRLYIDNDIDALKSLKELIQDKNMSLENATIIVVSRFKQDDDSSRSSAITPSVREDNNNELLNMLTQHIERQEEHIKKQESFNQELLKRLDEQSKYIDDRINQRDQSLMETLNRMTEQRKEEIRLLEESKENKGWLAKLFKK